MSRWWRSPLAPLAVLLLHGLALWLLARVDIVSALLGAARPNPLWLFVALAFYVLRLVAVFVAPGWLLAATVAALWSRLAAKRADG